MPFGKKANGNDTFKMKKRSTRTYTRTQSQYTLRGKKLNGQNKISLSFADSGKVGTSELIKIIEIPEDLLEDAVEAAKEDHPDASVAEIKTIAHADALNEWMAGNTVDFFSELSLLYATVEKKHIDMCKNGEPGVGFPPGCAYQFPGLDDNSAARYCDTTLAWIEDQVHNENVFPEDEDTKFPDDFIDTYVSKIFKRMFRIYAIILTTCWDGEDSMKAQESDEYCIASFKHFYFFMLRHDLLKNDQEKEALKNNQMAKTGMTLKSIEEEYRKSAAAYEATKN